MYLVHAWTRKLWDGWLQWSWAGFKINKSNQAHHLSGFFFFFFVCVVGVCRPIYIAICCIGPCRNHASWEDTLRFGLGLSPKISIKSSLVDFAEPSLSFHENLHCSKFRHLSAQLLWSLLDGFLINIIRCTIQNEGFWYSMHGFFDFLLSFAFSHTGSSGNISEKGFSGLCQSMAAAASEHLPSSSALCILQFTVGAICMGLSHDWTGFSSNSAQALKKKKKTCKALSVLIVCLFFVQGKVLI